MLPKVGAPPSNPAPIFNPVPSSCSFTWTLGHSKSLSGFFISSFSLSINPSLWVYLSIFFYMTPARFHLLLGKQAFSPAPPSSVYQESWWILTIVLDLAAQDRKYCRYLLTPCTIIFACDYYTWPWKQRLCHWLMLPLQLVDVCSVTGEEGRGIC